MASFSADTDLARELAAEFRAAAVGTDELGATATRALALAELQADVPIRAEDLADLLDRGGIVIRQQADILDGLDIDIDRFAAELDQDPDVLADQLRFLTESGIGAEAGIVPLVLWDGTTPTPDSLRDVFPGLPAPGVDPALDDALLRLDLWLLPALQLGDADDVALDEQRLADLAVLGALLGAGEAEATYTQRVSYRDNGETEHRTETFTTTVLDLGGRTLFDFVVQAYVEDEALSRLGEIPSFEDLVAIIVDLDQAEFQTLVDGVNARHHGGDRDDEQRRDRALERLRQGYDHLDPAALVAAFGDDLSWLGAVLAGVADPPDDAVARDRLVAFANATGLSDAADFDGALTDLRHQRLIQGELVLGDPTAGRLLFTDPTVQGAVDLGLRNGTITDDQVADAERVGRLILGDGDADALDLDGPPAEFDPAYLVQALALRVDQGVLTDNQLIAALSYVNGAGTGRQQLDRLTNVLLGFQTLATTGPPVLTRRQMERAVGPDVWAFANSRAFQLGRRHKEGDEWVTDFSDVPTHLAGQTDQWLWIVDNLGVPGYHKRKWGSRRLHLGIDGTGEVAGFQVERIRKRTWLKMVVMAGFTLVAGITQQWYMVYALTAKAALDGYREGGWEGALTAGAQTLLLAWGGYTMANWLAPATAGGITATGGATVNAAVTGARLTSAGVGIHQSIENGDIVEGVVAGTRALSVGAQSLEWVDTAANLSAAADIADGVNQSIDAVDEGDWVGLAAGVAIAGAGSLNLGAGSGLVDADTAKQFRSAATSLKGVGRGTVKVDATVEAIEDGDVTAAVQNGLGAVAEGARLFGTDSFAAGQLGLDPETTAAVDVIADFATGGSTLTGSVDAARRGEVLEAIALVAQATTEIEGGSEASLVAHRAEQLRAILRVAEVFVDIDQYETYTELATALAPRVEALGEAGKPPPPDTPLAASVLFEPLASAGEQVWDRLTAARAEPVRFDEANDELILVVGGFGDATLGGPVRNELVPHLLTENPDASIVYLSWDGADEGAALLRAFGNDPGRKVTVIGHSWGADTAFDIVAGAPEVEGVDVVTLDPVAWFPSDRPANVGSWHNVHVPGINHWSDAVAVVGGHQGPQDEADGDLRVPDTRLGGEDGLHHGDALGLYELLTADADTAALAPPVLADATAGPFIPAAAAPLTDFQSTLPNPDPDPDPGPDPGPTDFRPVTPQPPYTLSQLPVPPATAGPLTKVGPFAFSRADTQLDGASYKRGDVTYTVAQFSQQQTGYNGETVTHIERDGVHVQAESKTSLRGGDLTIGVERRQGDLSVDTSGPGLTGEAEGTFSTNKAELRVGVGKGGLLGVNYVEGHTDLQFTETSTEADGSTTVERGTTTQHDHTVHLIRGQEYKRDLLPNGPGQAALGGRLHAELGVTLVNEQKHSIITNSADPLAYTIKQSDVTVSALDGLGYGDLKVQGGAKSPVAGSVAGRSDVGFAMNLYVDQAESLQRVEAGRTTDVDRSRQTTYQLPGGIELHDRTIAEETDYNRDGSVSRQTLVDQTSNPLTDSLSSSATEFDPDGSMRSQSRERVDSIFGDVQTDGSTQRNADGSETSTTFRREDGYLTDTTTVTTVDRAADGSGTTREEVVEEGPFSTTTTTTTTRHEADGSSSTRVEVDGVEVPAPQTPGPPPAPIVDAAP